jgi:hypothetical protein
MTTKQSAHPPASVPTPADANALPIENFVEGLTQVAATLRKQNTGQAAFVLRAREYITHLETESNMQCMSIRCTKHLTILQQNFNEFTGAECGGCIAEERDLAQRENAELASCLESLAFQARRMTEIATHWAGDGQTEAHLAYRRINEAEALLAARQKAGVA